MPLGHNFKDSQSPLDEHSGGCLSDTQANSAALVRWRDAELKGLFEAWMQMERAA